MKATDENPSHLYTLQEVAAYCNRSYVHLRRLYQEGLLPDPINTKKFGRKTVRKFTLAEAKYLRDKFRGIKPGDSPFATLKKKGSNGKGSNSSD